MSSKSFSAKVSSLDAELEFNLEWNTMGRDLFDFICCTIALRGTRYFGLQFEDSKQFISWLKLDKKVHDQILQKDNKLVANFMFLAKFHMEDVADKLIQEVTQHLFFLLATSTKKSMMNHVDADQLGLEIEKERVEYLHKSKHLQNQLWELRNEIAVLKVGDKQTADHMDKLDKLQEQQVQQGDNKHSTLRKSKSGTTKSRVAFFEDL